MIITDISKVELPENLVGDQNRLRQVLINLVKHALKDNHDGAIEIKAAYDWDNEQLKVLVNNSGKGCGE